jgi:hypothetical protein
VVGDDLASLGEHDDPFPIGHARPIAGIPDDRVARDVEALDDALGLEALEPGRRLGLRTPLGVRVPGRSEDRAAEFLEGLVECVDRFAVLGIGWCIGGPAVGFDWAVSVVCHDGS